MSQFGSRRWPREIRLLKEERTLEIEFDDDKVFRYPAEYLRVESPSAEVMGHGPGQKQIIAERAEVGILEVEPVGHYAIRIKFDDLHDTGIYSWDYLRHLGENRDEIWDRYLQALEERSLSRHPQRR
ncbi:MAG: DUF971 domain-containing protein [Phreatobacter sp.]|uniref:DUF971 domain-containing protein n=1 Tax=Phreatobacter sp. TaxID=1966341 RepID=UPI001A5AFBE1|nr:DUF971 domain-containing protein [Phreatobacter sp.]MBL8570982.1 DUF971 domain-containing protein [Phreatobacter sp.]